MKSKPEVTEESRDEVYMKILRKIVDDPQISKKQLVKNILANCSSQNSHLKTEEDPNASQIDVGN